MSVPRARNTDPETSHEAAASVKHVRDSQRAVLAVLRATEGLTDIEIAQRYIRLSKNLPKQSPSGLRTRRKELVERGLVEDSGDKRKLPSGRNAIVWRAR